MSIALKSVVIHNAGQVIKLPIGGHSCRFRYYALVGLPITDNHVHPPASIFKGQGIANRNGKTLSK